jgi:hypothetical protein
VVISGECDEGVGGMIVWSARSAREHLDAGVKPMVCEESI